jgi:hypothetical protein
LFLEGFLEFENEEENNSLFTWDKRIQDLCNDIANAVVMN